MASSVNDQLQRGRKLLAQASPGPWRIEERGYVFGIPQGPDEHTHTIALVVYDQDRELIACAPELLAAYLAEIDRLRALTVEEFMATRSPADQALWQKMKDYYVVMCMRTGDFVEVDADKTP